MIGKIAVSVVAGIVAFLLILLGFEEWGRGWKSDGIVVFIGAGIVIFIGVLPWL